MGRLRRFCWRLRIIFGKKPIDPRPLNPPTLGDFPNSLAIPPKLGGRFCPTGSQCPLNPPTLGDFPNSLAIPPKLGGRFCPTGSQCPLNPPTLGDFPNSLPIPPKLAGRFCPTGSQCPLNPPTLGDFPNSLAIPPKLGGPGGRKYPCYRIRSMKNSRRIRGTTREIEEAAKSMRQNLTPAEALLWNALRGRQLAGLKFRCQHPVGCFILDFYCPACKLAIEVDGGIHAEQQDRDRARTEQLQSFGYTVLRFANEDVFNDLPRVLEQIAEVAKTLVP